MTIETLNSEQKLRLEAMRIAETENVLQFQLRKLNKLHTGDELELLAHYLSGLTSVMSCDQLHIRESGESGKGKSHIAQCVLKLFPENTFAELTSISPKSLFYIDKQESLDKKILFFDEAEASEGAIPILRMLTSSSSQRSSLQHWTVSDKKEAEKLQIRGRQVVWLNSSTPIEDEQLLNRFLICNPDESKEQDRQVYELQRETYCSAEEILYSEDFALNVAITKEILDPDWNVVIPFGRFIELPLVENRRNAPKFFTLIKACTQANILQRQNFDSPKYKVLIATREDYETALIIWQGMQQLTESKVSSSALRLLEQIPLSKEEAIGNEGLAEETGLDSARVRRLTRELYVNGLVNYIKPERAFLYYYPSVRSWTELSNTVDWQNFEGMVEKHSELLTVPKIPKIYEILKEHISDIVSLSHIPKSLHQFIKSKENRDKPKNNADKECTQKDKHPHSPVAFTSEVETTLWTADSEDTLNPIPRGKRTLENKEE